MQHNLHLFNKLFNFWEIYNQDLNKTAITETRSSRLRKPATEKLTQSAREQPRGRECSGASAVRSHRRDGDGQAMREISETKVGEEGST